MPDKKQLVQTMSNDFAALSAKLEEARVISERIYSNGKLLIPLVDNKAPSSQKMLVDAGQITAKITAAQAAENQLHIDCILAAKKLNIDLPPVTSVSGIQITPMSGAR